MLFTFTSTILVLASISTAATVPFKRQDIAVAHNVVACDFQFIPVSTVPPTLNLSQAFNTVIGFGVSGQAGPNVTVHAFGATVIPNPIDTKFAVHDTISIDGKNGAQTILLVDGLKGKTLKGSVVPFTVQDVVCA